MRVRGMRGMCSRTRMRLHGTTFPATQPAAGGGRGVIAKGHSATGWAWRSCGVAYPARRWRLAPVSRHSSHAPAGGTVVTAERSRWGRAARPCLLRRRMAAHGGAHTVAARGRHQAATAKARPHATARLRPTLGPPSTARPVTSKTTVVAAGVLALLGCRQVDRPSRHHSAPQPARLAATAIFATNI